MDAIPPFPFRNDWPPDENDQRTINFAAIEKFQRTHRWVGECVIWGKRYDWWKRPDGTLVLIGPVT